MEIKVEKQDSLTVLSIAGRVDTVSAKDFELEVSKLLNEDCSNVVFDCTDLEYVSSSGLRVFLIMQKGVNAKKGKLLIKGMSQPIKEIFNMTGFSSIFNIE